jgi:hypothetical protein
MNNYQSNYFIVVIRIILSRVLQLTTQQEKHAVVCLDGVVAD